MTENDPEVLTLVELIVYHLQNQQPIYNIITL